MPQTQRHQENQIMSYQEKQEYVRIIKTSPHLYKPILRELSTVINRNVKTILDVACGSGHLLDLINKNYAHLKLVGVDVDPFFIEVAKSKYKYDFYIEDAYSFSQKADIVICNLALHHLDYPTRALDHMCESANVAVIVSDQVRPETEQELRLRLRRRDSFVQPGFKYYERHERESILEAYSKNELKQIFQQSKMPFELKFIDEDYYERVIAVAIK